MLPVRAARAAGINGLIFTLTQVGAGAGSQVHVSLRTTALRPSFSLNAFST